MVNTSLDYDLTTMVVTAVMMETVTPYCCGPVDLCLVCAFGYK